MFQRKIKSCTSVNDVFLKFPSPSTVFIIILLIFQFIPGLYIYIADHFENLYGEISGSYSDYALEFVLSCSVFIGSVIIGRHFIPISSLNISFNSKISYFCMVGDLYGYVGMLGILACGLISIYFFAGGYEKFLLIGSDINSWDFRITGYDDRARYLIVFLEIARKFLLPISILYAIILKRMHVKVSKKLIFLFIFFQIIASAMTFDRAPFFILMVVILFPYLITKWTFIRFSKFLLLLLLIMFLLGGLITNLQYNIVDFTIIDIISMGIDFVFHRVLLIPSITPIELSFAIFNSDSQKLWLEYSRLNQLIGGRLVGTSEDVSIFVSPVGAVGDIWRNFGVFGLFVCGGIVGLISKIFDFWRINTPFPVIVVQYFLVVSLAFYYVMGVFFSQGAILALLLCCIHIPLMRLVLRVKTV